VLAPLNPDQVPAGQGKGAVMFVELQYAPGGHAMQVPAAASQKVDGSQINERQTCPRTTEWGSDRINRKIRKNSVDSRKLSIFLPQKRL